jgi:hypothetical protein
MPKLYEISEEIERFMLDCVDKETGELDEDALKNLEALEGERIEKCLAVAAYMKGELAEANAIEAHALEIQKMANAHIERGAKHRRHAQSLLKYLQRHAPHEPISDSRCEFVWRKSDRVEYQEGMGLEDVPARYRVKKTTVSLDKNAAKKVLRAGKKVKGLYLDKVETLTIK